MGRSGLANVRMGKKDDIHIYSLHAMFDLTRKKREWVFYVPVLGPGHIGSFLSFFLE